MMGAGIGIGGSFATGFLMNSAGISGYPGTIPTTSVAMICAILLTSRVATTNGRGKLALSSMNPRDNQSSCKRAIQCAVFGNSRHIIRGGKLVRLYRTPLGPICSHVRQKS